MTAQVALLRAVNDGGRGKLTMDDLRAICIGCGLANVRTYLQHGNVVFDSDKPERALQRDLQRAVTDKMGRIVGVLMRTGAEMRAIVNANPFPKGDPDLIGVVFLPRAVPERLLIALELGGPEDVRMIGREIYVHFPDGMGRSKMKIPFASDGTIRTLDVIEKLASMAGA